MAYAHPHFIKLITLLSVSYPYFINKDLSHERSIDQESRLVRHLVFTEHLPTRLRDFLTSPRMEVLDRFGNVRGGGHFRRSDPMHAGERLYLPEAKHRACWQHFDFDKN